MASRTKKSQSQIAEEVRAKANSAEANAGKTRKPEAAKPAEAKPADEVKPAATKERPAKPASTAVKSNDDQDRALFLQALPKIGQMRAALNTANANLRNAYKQAKADGFAKKDFDEAFLMQGAEGEKVKKATISRSLRIARWLGMDLGAQLDMFEQDARVPAIDRAYEEGKSQAMQGISLKCDYAQETEQYRTFAAGWHHGQEILSKGFKQLHPEVAADEKAKLIKRTTDEAAKAEDAKAFDAPASGVAMTRADFNKQKEQQAKPN